jgi:hypothetical protein
VNACAHRDPRAQGQQEGNVKRGKGVRKGARLVERRKL